MVDLPEEERLKLFGQGPARLRLRVKRGGWRVVEATTKVLFHDEMIGGLLTHCRDISDYVAVEETLRESLTRLDAIVDTAAEGILTLDLRGDVLSLNRAGRAMFGLTEECDTLTVQDLFTESSGARIMAHCGPCPWN